MSGPALDEALRALRRFAGASERVDGIYDARGRAIREAWNAGASITQIARVLGVGRKVVYEAIREEDR